MEEEKTFSCWKGIVKEDNHIPKIFRGKEIYVCVPPPGSGYVIRQVTVTGKTFPIFDFDPFFFLYASPYWDEKKTGKLSFPKDDVLVDQTKVYMMPDLPYELLTMERH